MFKAEKFNADKWAALFKESGAKFVMPVCEHHDGFAMYDTVFNRWNAKAMGPCRDITGEIKKACENNGLTFCASTHRAEHYFFMNMGRTFDSDVNDESTEIFTDPLFIALNGTAIQYTKRQQILIPSVQVKNGLRTGLCAPVN